MSLRRDVPLIYRDPLDLDAEIGNSAEIKAKTNSFNVNF